MTVVQVLLTYRNNQRMNEEAENNIIKDLNEKLGDEFEDFSGVYSIRSELLAKKHELEKSLSLASSEVPSKVSAALSRAEAALEKIKSFQEKAHALIESNEKHFSDTLPVREKLGEPVDEVRRLEASKDYLDSLQAVQQLSIDLKKCTDSEQCMLIMQQLYELRDLHQTGHRGAFIAKTKQYWYNVFKEKFSKEFDEVLKQLRWPFTSATIVLNSTLPAESMVKFRQLSQYLLQLQSPEVSNDDNNSQTTEHNLCLPVRLMLKPLKKRFTYHFSGSRKTNRLDRPEWFLTQILSWLRDHLPFLGKHLQAIVKGMDMNIDVQREFTCGLMNLAVERLHVLLATVVLDDRLFSHAVDECLGFHRELEAAVGNHLSPNCPRITAVLTDARYLIRWLALEKKFAIQRIDEMLSGEEWLQQLGSNNSGLGDNSEMIPQGADWLVALLQTLHDRYSVLPEPQHRLQFLWLQIELCEELRVRLTQLISEELRRGAVYGGRGLEAAPRLLAILNVTHHLRQALIDWAQSVPYLQLYYYKRQFQYFIDTQHLPIPDVETTPRKSAPVLTPTDESDSKLAARVSRGSICLNEVEAEAHVLAQREAEHLRQQSLPTDILRFNEELDTEGGAFEELPGLLGRLIDGTCTLICDDLVLEVKAAARDYRNQKWHCLPEVNDWRGRSLSPALCSPLGALSTRLLRLRTSLVPQLFAPLWRAVAREIDQLIFEEVVVECWWGAGGIEQFHFDMHRNLLPIFAQYTSSPGAHFPRIKESCTLFFLPLNSAMILKDEILEAKDKGIFGPMGKDCAPAVLAEISIRHITLEDAFRVLSRRSDLNLKMANLID